MAEVDLRSLRVLFLLIGKFFSVLVHTLGSRAGFRRWSAQVTICLDAPPTPRHWQGRRPTGEGGIALSGRPSTLPDCSPGTPSSKSGPATQSVNQYTKQFTYHQLEKHSQRAQIDLRQPYISQDSFRITPQN